MRRRSLQRTDAATILAGASMNPFVLLFDFRGRINRAQFWLAVLIQLVFFFTVVGSLMMISTPLDSLFDLTLVGYAPLVASAAAIGTKRLHDRDKSVWWLAIFAGVPLLISELVGYGLSGQFNVLHQVLLSLSFAINIWALIEFGFLHGTIGANRYGSDPLAA
jgi:uncharacterized membrane protein YhaH (DUF805 family)